MKNIEIVLDIIAKNPGITSTDLRVKYAEATGTKANNAYDLLTKLHKSGQIKRVSKLEKTPSTTFRVYAYRVSEKKPVKPASVPAPVAAASATPAVSETRPFNLEHARAGAPIATRTGLSVEILKWDRSAATPIVGIINDKVSTVMAWNREGVNSLHESNHLIMLPLGHIDGKPVFVGDEVEEDRDEYGNGGAFKVAPNMRQGHFGHCRWPAPAKVYPESTCSLDLLAIAFTGGGGHTHAMALRAVANAAIRHAIDAGQVVEVKRESIEALGWVPAGHDADRRAARDMAIAEAVHQACLDLCEPYSASQTRVRKNMDLATIIASVQP